MGRKAKYSKEEKINTCKDYLSGKESFSSIARSIGTSSERIEAKINNYYKHYAYIDTSSYV